MCACMYACACVRVCMHAVYLTFLRNTIVLSNYKEYNSIKYIVIIFDVLMYTFLLIL